MRFIETKLKGAYIIEIEPIEDERGFFSRTFCQKEFKEHGLNPYIAQCNISYNKKRGTLRGMHYQIAPHEEAKIVSCIKGSMYDVIIDLRPDSSTYCQWFATKLYGFNFSSTHKPINSLSHPPINPSTYQLLYIPKGMAHGFQTLEDDTVVFYQMSDFFYPESARGVRWDDPIFGIMWPDDNRTMSIKDQQYLDFVV